MDLDNAMSGLVRINSSIACRIRDRMKIDIILDYVNITKQQDAADITHL